MPFFIPAMMAVMAATTAASAASSAVGAMGQIAGGKAASRAANKQADNVIFESRYRINDIERQRMNTRAAQKAIYATSGVKLSGSPLELLAETNILAAFDIARVKFKADEDAMALRTTGAEARRSAYLDALGTGISGVGNLGQSALGGYQLGRALSTPSAASLPTPKRG